MDSDATDGESPLISKGSSKSVENDAKSEEIPSKPEEIPSKTEEITKEINNTAKTEDKEGNKQICDRDTCKWAKEIEETVNQIAKLDSKPDENEGGVEIETNIDITLEIKSNKTDGGKECVCGEENKELTIDCPCGKESVAEEVEEEEPELKRFIILKKIPCGWKEQCEILKVSSTKIIILIIIIEL